jgi:hypothetical protein
VLRSAHAALGFLKMKIGAERDALDFILRCQSAVSMAIGVPSVSLNNG